MVKSPVFLFIGHDAYSREKAIKDLSSSILDDSSRQFDYKVFHGDDASPDEVFGNLTTPPFQASRRFVVIKDFGRLSKDFKSRLISYIANPSRSACLVLESGDDSVLKDLGDMASRVNIRRFGALPEADSFAWTREILASRGKTIDPDAARHLMESRGHDTLGLSQELEKLAVFVGEKKNIETGDVEALVGRDITVSAFDLTRAIEADKIEDALKICSDLIVSGKRHYEIIGLLSWQFKRILKAKELQKKGEPRYAIANILKIGRRYSDDFFKQADSMTISGARSRLRILLEADLDIKRTKFNPNLVLEFAVIRLCLNR